jgi:F0F1-type ATP synthase assembly protein I
MDPDRERPGGRDPAGATRGDSAVGRLGALAGLGLQFAVFILVFLYAGQWVDRRLGTEPVFLLVGVFGGAAAGFYRMYRGLMRAQQREEEERRR